MPLLENKFILDVDIKEVNYAYERKVTANDSITFVVNLTNEGQPIDLTNVETVSLANTRLDKTTIVTPGTKTDSNQVTFELGQNETKTPGRVTAIVQLYDADGRLSTLGFNYTVIDDPTGHGYTPPGSDQTLIQVVLGDGPLVIDQARTATTNAETATTNAEIATANANTATTNANTATTNAEAATTNANSAATSANTATTNAEAKITDAETRMQTIETEYNDTLKPDVVQATSDANTATTNANNAATSANNAANNANAAASNANTAANTVDTKVESFDAAINSTVLNYLSPVNTYAELPSSASEGDLVQVVADTDATKNGNYRRTGGVWKLVQKNDLTAKADKADIEAVDIARADIVRQMVHSGVLDYSSQVVDVTKTSANKPGQITIKSDTPNQLGILNSDFIINGYEATRDSGNSGLFTLPPPPPNGTRDDLVFLEAWFPQDTPNKMDLRIRTVEGVDFEKYTEDGFTDGGYGGGSSWFNSKITAQGGNTTPTVSDGTYKTQFINQARRKTGTFGSLTKVAPDDIGLYIAGAESQTKDLLKTADGYVYAIPLFRVKRRNSGGYRVDNLNGAREYYTTGEFTTYSSMDTVGQSSTAILTDTTKFESIVVGDLLSRSDGRVLKVLSKSAPDTIVVELQSGGGMASTTHGAFNLLSDRPDAKYANIIDKDDIIDLRHKVSLTGYNYQQLLEENFDKLLRGELRTKDTETMYKQRFGLQKAPNNVESELMPVEVKVPNHTGAVVDGVYDPMKVEFYGITRTNLLGHEGGFHSQGSWHNNITIDNSVYKFGTSSGKIDNSTGTGQKVAPSSQKLFLSGKHVLVGIWVKSVSGTPDIDVVLTGYDSEGNSTSSKLAINEVVNSSWKFYYGKVDLTSNTDSYWNVRLDVDTYGTADDVVNFDGLNVQIIDQATADKIGVLTDEQVAEQFPYVSSYPNVVENLWHEERVINPLSQTVYGSDLEVGTFSVTFLAKSPSGSNARLAVRTTNLGYIDRPYMTTDFKEYSYTFTTDSSDSLGLQDYNQTEDIEIKLIKVTSLDLQVSDIDVPYGRWYLPHDYADGQVPNQFNVKGQRKTVSDAQISEVVTDSINPTDNAHLPHVSTTQATVGQWAVGDTITIKADYPMTGVIDSDTAIAKVTAYGSGSTQAYLDTVEKLSVNDQVTFYNLTNHTSVTRVITAIDTANKIITLDSAPNCSAGDMVVESTASTSSPNLTHTSTNTITGTWTNLGTKEITYTIDGITDGVTTGLTDTTEFQIQYSVNYPAGEGVDYLPSEVLGAKVNGQDLTKDNTLRIKANFEGKVSGNTDLVAHMSKHNDNGSTTVLLSPTDFGNNESSSNAYNWQSKLDGDTNFVETINTDTIAQRLFSFNIIRAIEDKLGEQFFSDCLTLADKVAKLKSRITNFKPIWYGYGSSPTGNKGTLAIWQNSWADITHNTANNPTKTQYSGTLNATTVGRVDDNGFVHFLAYAEPSDGVTASTIYTDYVELELELDVTESGYDVLVPEEKFPQLSENLLTENQAFPVDLTDLNSYGSSNLSVNKLGVLEISTDGLTTQGVNTSPNKVKVIPNEYYSFSVKLKGNGTVDNLCIGQFSNSGYLSDTGKVQGINLTDEWATYKAIGKIDSNVKEVVIIVYSDTASNIQAKDFKLEKGVNTNPVWTPGRRKKTVHNFLGKVAGSTWENGNKTYRYSNPNFDNPSSYQAEHQQGWYDLISKQDGQLYNYVSSTGSNYAQTLFEFDLSHLGLSLKELKDALRKITVSWTGYGSGSNAGVLEYGADIRWWYNNNSWVKRHSSTSSSPTTVQLADTNTDYLTKDQKVYILVHSTHPSDGTIASEIYTDYVKLEVELADYVDYVPANVVKVRKETKEMKLAYPTKSHRTGIEDSLELWYKHVPYQGIGANQIIDKPLTDSVIVITSEGSGDITDSYYRNAINNLPIRRREVETGIAKILSFGGATGYSIRVNMSRSSVEGVGSLFLLGEDKISSSSSTQIPLRGSRTNDGWHLSAYNDELIALGKYGLIVQALIVLELGVPVMRIVTHKETIRHSSEYTSVNGKNLSVDSFTLLGRPLIKGVN